MFTYNYYVPFEIKRFFLDYLDSLELDIMGETQIEHMLPAGDSATAVDLPIPILVGNNNYSRVHVSLYLLFTHTHT